MGDAIPPTIAHTQTRASEMCTANMMLHVPQQCQGGGERRAQGFSHNIPHCNDSQGYQQGLLNLCYMCTGVPELHPERLTRGV
ncbi:hypothetical protein M404DRAFT_1005432 [Pisolithus tinctorius Marx 270]|uniref:Uncharacterized protein n=1 Tax=Pisolithus tinctorius Marx 270 TaxID=870435 RepID=A0A0C3JL44_PISTI|nr:hypothetical protein M404DRAFT_1005432 [Pisolithus tinctorius Marx 270]